MCFSISIISFIRKSSEFVEDMILVLDDLLKYKFKYNQRVVFILFLFDIFYFLTPETVNLLKIVQKIVYNNIVSLTGPVPMGYWVSDRIGPQNFWGLT
jgi:hypothetical protein